MQTITEFKERWKNSAETCKAVKELFEDMVDADPALKAHRDFIEHSHYGFGERAFHYMWKLIVNELPDDFRFMEIGVYKGQVISLIRLLAPKATIYGVTPLDSSGGMADRDYRKDIEDLHDAFALPNMYRLFVGKSQDPDIINQVLTNVPYLDVLYIDGGHEFEEAYADILNYSPLVKKGGYMVIDDCANRFSHPFGYFMGIDSVSAAVDKLLPPRKASNEWEHLGNVIHNRIWRRL